jgi:hypothetical protein
MNNDEKYLQSQLFRLQVQGVFPIASVTTSLSLCHGYDIKDQLKGRVRTGEPGSPEYYTLIRR